MKYEDKLDKFQNINLNYKIMAYVQVLNHKLSNIHINL